MQCCCQQKSKPKRKSFGWEQIPLILARGPAPLDNLPPAGQVNAASVIRARNWLSVQGLRVSSHLRAAGKACELEPWRRPPTLEHGHPPADSRPVLDPAGHGPRQILGPVSANAPRTRHNPLSLFLQISSVNRTIVLDSVLYVVLYVGLWTPHTVPHASFGARLSYRLLRPSSL